MNDPTINLITLTFKDQKRKLFVESKFVCCYSRIGYVVLPKEEKEEFFSLDKIRRTTADEVREQATKRLRTG